MPVNGLNRRKQNFSGHTVVTKLRNIPPPRMQQGETKTWGAHLVQSLVENSYRCTFCEKVATGFANIRAMAKTPCLGK
eukprot:16430227-Heterocapsa_arctica.AAC.1